LALVGAAASAADTFRVYFSAEPTRPATKEGEKETLSLRPNIEQQFYLFVENLTEKKATARVELRAGGKPLPGAVADKIEVPAREVVRVNFAPKPPPPSDKPPAPAEVKGELEAVVFDGEQAQGKPASVRVAKPSDYLEDPEIAYNPTDNSLRVTVRAREPLTPRCRVELVLHPDRIPALVEEQKLEGSYGGFLEGTEPLELVAKSLRFKTVKDPSQRSGLVYLKIDGYERAYTYYTSFAASDERALPERISLPIARINAPGVTATGPPGKVGVELDNIEKGTVARLGLYRDPSCKQLESPRFKFPSDRRETVFFSPLGPDGALLFRTKVEDWTTDLDTASIFGLRTLCLQLRTKNDKPVQVINSAAPIERVRGEEFLTTDTITANLVIDGSPPEDLSFVDFPKKLPRGDPLVVKAAGKDPESTIASVVFFLGKPEANGAIPKTAVKTDGEREGATNVWAATLPVPTDKPATVQVSAQFTNGVGLTKTIGPVIIKLVDAKAGGGATIKGSVVEGERAQAGLTVVLRDPQGVPKDTVTTGKDGIFVFKNVPPGTYQIVARKTSSNTVGQAAVQVAAGEEKVLAEPIKLVR
jgi:hypothetical protein